MALNPITNSNFSSTQGFEHCYESLTAFDAKAQIVPALAERWDTPDPTTYVFHIRRGVKFHDGSELTAEDVKYTFDIVLDPKGRPSGAATSTRWTRSRSSTGTRCASSPRPRSRRFWAPSPILRSSAIIPKGAMEKLKLETQVVGTGPYRLVEYVPKSHIKLRKNPDYWGKPLPYLDEVTFRILEEEDARVAGLRAGSLDYGFLTPEGIQRLRGDSRIVVSSRPARICMPSSSTGSGSRGAIPARARPCPSPPTARRSSRRCSRVGRRWPGRSRLASATGT